MAPRFEVFLIAIGTAWVTALPGVFLVVRGMALLGDALSHALVFGIAVMFLLTQSMNFVVLFGGALVTGLLVALLVELLVRSDRMAYDAALGIVFPLFFSTGVLLISRYARDVHLDLDMVMVGELVFAPFKRVLWAGYDWGPHALIVALFLGICFAIVLMLWHRPVWVMLFDRVFARCIGISVTGSMFGLLGATSIAAVSAFDSVGAVVVVAFMIVPATTALFFARSLRDMIVYALTTSLCMSLGGCLWAWYADISLAGACAVCAGIVFFIAYGVSLERASAASDAVCRELVKEYIKKAPQGWTVEELARDFNWPISKVLRYKKDEFTR